MKLPKFTIRELMLSTALIATGIGVILAVFRLNQHHSPALVTFAFFGCPLSGPLIGAGLFLPFGKTRVGALYGLLIMLIGPCLFSMVFQQLR